MKRLLAHLTGVPGLCGGGAGRRLPTVWLAAGFLILAWATTARAAGQSFVLAGHDLQITVDTRWAGNANGGYYPIRLRVVNRGPSRLLTFGFDSQSREQMPRVRREMNVQQNATVRFTLAIPMVSRGSGGRLTVLHDGSLLEGMERLINLPEPDDSGESRPALLVISPNNVDCDRFEEAYTSLSSVPASGRPSYYGSVMTEDHEVIEPNMLPESWIDYSGLDIVALSLDTLGKMALENRSAILHWVQTGGTLIVYDVGGAAQASVELNGLLQFRKHSFAGERWEPCDLRERRPIRIVTTDQHGHVVSAESAPSQSLPADATPSVFSWKANSDTFARRKLMNGLVYAFEETPFPGSAHDWAWFLNSLGSERYHWITRNGISARLDSDEFLHFLIDPGIKGVPVSAFIILITIFTIVIGPLNYFLLVRRKQLYMLLLTIPVVAFATSLILFGYSIVAHGFAVKSRLRSLTVLDQKSQTAVSTSRLALYAGLAPSKGLRFEPETTVYPIWPTSQAFETGNLDWTQTQALTSGWLRSRTRTQFLTTSHRVERGRLEVQAPDSDRLPVANGLEWGLDVLLVADENGDLYFGSEIDAGASTALAPASEEKLNVIKHLLKQHPLSPPHISNTNSLEFFGGMGPGRTRRWHRGGRKRARFSTSLMERRIMQLQAVDSAPSSVLSPRSYLAVVNGNPGIQLGVDESNPKVSLHLLVGYY